MKVAGFEDGGNWGHLIGTTYRLWKMQGMDLFLELPEKNATPPVFLFNTEICATSNLQNCKTVNFCYVQLLFVAICYHCLMVVVELTHLGW